MIEQKLKRALKRASVGLTILLSVLLAVLAFDYVHTRSQTADSLIRFGQDTSNELKDDINELLTEAVDSADTLTTLLENRDVDRAELERKIRQVARAIPQVAGVTVCFEKDAFIADDLYCPYFDKRKNEFVYIEDVYDYTDDTLETARWYTSVRDKGARWVEPYFAKGAQALVADYGKPFYFSSEDKKGKVKGTVTMTISLESFTSLIHAISIGKTGAGIVASPKGKLIAYPDTDLVGKADLVQLANTASDPTLQQAFKKLLAGETGHVRFVDKEVNGPTLFYYDTVPVSQWRIGLSFFEKDLINNQETIKRKLITLTLVFTLVLLCLLGTYYNADHFSIKESYRFSVVATVLLGANVLFIAMLQHNAPRVIDRDVTTPITDVTTLEGYISEQRRALREAKKTDSFHTIPTGIYIRTIDFEDSYNVEISGDVWQRYPKDIYEEVTVGFQFPQASPFAESLYIEQTYEEEMDEAMLVRFEFRTSLRLNFNYSHYPFDKRHLPVEITPINVEDNLFFVPNLDSYAYTNPSTKPGLDSSVYLPGSNITKTYFAFAKHTPNTSYGHDYGERTLHLPSMYYTMQVQRILLNPLVTYLIPVFVTLLMIFIMICATHKPKSREGAGGIVEAMAAFFFVLIFSHIDLRKSIETPELMYIEYFYLISYLMVTFSTYNLITFTREPNRVFDYQDNLFMRILFWPIFGIAILAVTLAKFY